MIDLTTPYLQPAVRSCERIEPEPDEVIRVALQQCYSTLTDQLPLKGFSVKRHLLR